MPYTYKPVMPVLKRRKRRKLKGIRTVLPQAVQHAIALSHATKGGTIRRAIIDNLAAEYKSQGYRSVKKALVVRLRKAGYRIPSERQHKENLEILKLNALKK